MKKYLTMLGNLLIYVATYLIVIRSLVAFGKGVLLKLPVFGPWLNSNALLVTVTSDLIQFTILYFIFKLFKHKSLFNYVKLTEKMSKMNIAIVVIIGVASGFFTSAVLSIKLITDKYPDLAGIMQYMFLEGGNFIIFTMFLLVGSVFKEILFRGLIFNELRDKLPVVIAVIIQGLLYGLLFFKLNIPLIAYGFLGAVLFTLLYIWTDSLWASIIAQASCQGIMYILIRTGDSILNNSSIPFVIAISLIIIVAATIYLGKNRKTNSSIQDNSISIG